MGSGGSGQRGRSAGTYRQRRGGRRPRAATARAQQEGSGVCDEASRPAGASATEVVTSGTPARRRTKDRCAGCRFCPPDGPQDQLWLRLSQPFQSAHNKCARHRMQHLPPQIRAPMGRQIASAGGSPGGECAPWLCPVCLEEHVGMPASGP
ncbi:hypothetical protein LEMLEM_LOCUS12613 [Lemmus lemmus]